MSVVKILTVKESPPKKDDEWGEDNLDVLLDSLGNDKKEQEAPINSNTQKAPIEVVQTASDKPLNTIRRNYLDTKNPYSKESKIDLDDEWKKGFRQIGTSVVLSLISAGLTGNELSLFLYIHHRTWGFCNKKNGFKHVESEIPIREILEKTKIARTTIHRSLEGLEARKMIYRVTDKNTNREKIGVNLRFDTWSNLS
jgi:hypothetical protein